MRDFSSFLFSWAEYLELLFLFPIFINLVVLFSKDFRTHLHLKHSFNLFYLSVKEKTKEPYLPTKAEKEAELKSARIIRRVLSAFYFAPIILRAWSSSIQNIFFERNFYFYASTFYYLWTMYCLYQINNDLYGTMPLNLNPVTRFKFNKHYNKFIEQCCSQIKEYNFAAYSNDDCMNILLLCLSCNYKHFYIMYSREYGAKDDYRVLIANMLYNIIYILFTEGSFGYIDAKQTTGKESFRILYELYHSILQKEVDNGLMEQKHADEELEFLQKKALKGVMDF